jgi:hypothetical protein
MNAAVEQIMVVVDTTKDTFAGTTEAEMDSVLVSLKDPLSGTFCCAQPGPYGYLKSGMTVKVKQLKYEDDPSKVSVFVIVDDEDYEARSTEPPDTEMADVDTDSNPDKEWMIADADVPSLLASCSLAAEQWVSSNTWRRRQQQQQQQHLHTSSPVDGAGADIRPAGTSSEGEADHRQNRQQRTTKLQRGAKKKDPW